MAYSLQQVTSDGTLNYLALSFTYTDRSTIHVFYDGVENTTNWAWAGPTETAITFSPNVPTGVEVLVRRISPLDSVDHIFGYRSDGSGNAAFSADSVDDNFEQTFKVAQEVSDVNDLTADYAASANADAIAAAASAAAALASANASDVSEAAALASQVASAASAVAANLSKVAAELAETNAETAETNAETAQGLTYTARDAAIAAKVAAEAADADAIAQAAAALGYKNDAGASAVAALASENAAGASAVAAANSAASAASALDNFDDRYLGAKTSDPGVDNDGNALVAGALYFNSATGKMRVFTGSGWIDASSASVVSYANFEFVATAGQTTFSGNDANGVPLSYTVGATFVTLNGVMLRNGDDYTASTGSSIVLGTACTLSDEVQVFSFGSFLVADTYTRAEADGKFIQQTSNTGAAQLPVGTTAQAPAGAPGLTRFDSTLGNPVWYDPSTSTWKLYSQPSGYTINYLIVGGGAGGGQGYYGGGGGAGGYLAASTTLLAGVAYTITIGAGGAGSISQTVTGTNGSNSSAFTAVALGGGGGGSRNNDTAGGPSNGAAGGSGGGGAYPPSTGGAGTSGQGNAGGSSASGYGCGGGGAGAVGSPGTVSAPYGGAGGVGISNSISGAAVYYCGGGGAGMAAGGVANGGTGGGGSGGINTTGTPGTANTGGGGGAGGFAASNGAAGGSGIVIFAYLGAQRGTGGTVTSSGGYTIHTFTTSGTYNA